MAQPKPNLTEMGHCLHDTNLYEDWLPLLLTCCYCGAETTFGITYIAPYDHGPFAPRDLNISEFKPKLKECQVWNERFTNKIQTSPSP